MNNYFNRVHDYLLDLNYEITYNSVEEGMLVVDAESHGIQSLVIGVADPILIMEQFILELGNDNADIYRNLLQKNRDIIHGAFVLDESGRKVIFRNTLELENLDLNELEASFNSLSLLLSEYTNELIEFSKN